MGKNDSISYRVCIQKPKTDNRLKHAMRYAISDQMLKFKNSCEYLKCEFCESKDNTQTDHVIYLNNHMMIFKINTIPIPTDYNYNYYNVVMFGDDDDEFKNNWIQYHKQYAILSAQIL